MPHVDVLKPEVVITSAISNSAIPTSQPDANTEVTLNGSPVRPKAQNPTPQQHGGLSVPTNGFHLAPMTNMTTPVINSALGQNQPHTGGLSLQQMQNLKTAFASIPATDLALQIFSASCMNLATNGTNMNMQLPAGASMKMSPARQMQRAMNSASFQRPASVANGADGQLSGGTATTASSTLGNATSSSPAVLRSPSANDARTPSRNGVHVNGQHSLIPHAQPSSSPLLNNKSIQVQRSPRPSMASTVGIPSSSLQQQQAVKTTQNNF
jgi:enhancer of polycomb-like protein